MHGMIERKKSLSGMHTCTLTKAGQEGYPLSFAQTSLKGSRVSVVVLGGIHILLLSSSMEVGITVSYEGFTENMRQNTSRASAMAVYFQAALCSRGHEAKLHSILLKLLFQMYNLRQFHPKIKTGQKNLLLSGKKCLRMPKISSALKKYWQPL